MYTHSTDGETEAESRVGLAWAAASKSDHGNPWLPALGFMHRVALSPVPQGRNMLSRGAGGEARGSRNPPETMDPGRIRAAMD